MTDWVKDAAQRARNRRDRRDQLNSAMDNQLSRFWDSFEKTVRTLVDKFNSQDEIGSIFKVVSQEQLGVSFDVALRDGTVGPGLRVNLDKAGRVMRCVYQHVKMPVPQPFYLDIDAGGQLCFVYEEQQKNGEEVAQMLLEPLFDSVY